MDTIFLLLFLLSFFAIFIFLILALVAKRKDALKSKKHLKSVGISILVSFVTFIGFGVTVDDAKPTEEVASDVKADTSKEVAKSEVELKAEVDAKKAAEEKEKTDKLAAEKEYYTTKIDPMVNQQMEAYDKGWNEYWITTFEGVGNGTVNAYTAYDNMKVLKQHYDNLYSAYNQMEAPELSKENEKLFDTFTSKMQSAAMWRGEAVEKAQEMFDTGDASPSKLDEMKKDVAYADNEMMQAAIALTSLKMELGLLEEETQ